MGVSSQTKHLVQSTFLISWIFLFCFYTEGLRFGPHPVDSLDPWVTHGPVVTVIIIFLRFLSFLALPQTLFNLVGLLTLNKCILGQLRLNFISWEIYLIVNYLKH